MNNLYSVLCLDTFLVIWQLLLMHRTPDTLLGKQKQFKNHSASFACYVSYQLPLKTHFKSQSMAASEEIQRPSRLKIPHFLAATNYAAPHLYNMLVRKTISSLSRQTCILCIVAFATTAIKVLEKPTVSFWCLTFIQLLPSWEAGSRCWQNLHPCSLCVCKI